MDNKMLKDLLEDAAKLWLAHDGLWFQAVERKFGMDAAIELDIEAWRRFSPIEAMRLMNRLDLPESGGVDALVTALNHRLYSYINEQTVEKIDERTVEIRMNNCRVQAARERKGMALFPCKPVGVVEYTTFAETIDPRFETTCLTCPPDERPDDHYCAWRFVLKK
jgi:hypothetical protein